MFKNEKHLEVNCFAFGESLLHLAYHGLGMTIENVEIANPILGEIWTGDTAVESKEKCELVCELLSLTNDAYFHMSPSELKTPVPSTESIYERKSGPFSNLLKSLARMVLIKIYITRCSLRMA